MKIVQPYARLMSSPGHLPDVPFTEAEGATLRRIEWCARISHRSEDDQKDSYRRFIESVVLGHGDWSVVEHVTASVDMLVDRGITHELVRHRLFSFTQESTRFVNYEKKMPPSFIYPKPEVICDRCLHGYDHVVFHEDGWTHSGPKDGCICLYDPCWLDAIDTAESAYRNLLLQGWRPQEARSVFPNALASRIIVTGNLRNWRHFFIMRTTQEAHPQMRQVTIPLLAEFQKNFAILFDDIVPMQKQAEAMKKAR